MEEQQSTATFKKEKKPKPVLDIPRHDEIEYESIVVSNDSHEIKKKILKEGTGKLPNENSTIKCKLDNSSKLNFSY
jgi:hypothetical protein